MYRHWDWYRVRVVEIEIQVKVALNRGAVEMWVKVIFWTWLEKTA